MLLLERIIFYLLFFIGMPAVIFFFVRAIQRDKGEVERLKARKEVLELELRHEEARAKTLAEENRKYDHLIADAEKEGSGKVADEEPEAAENAGREEEPKA